MAIFPTPMAIMAINKSIRLNPYHSKVIHQHHKTFVNYTGNCHVIMSSQAGAMDIFFTIIHSPSF